MRWLVWMLIVVAGPAWAEPISATRIEVVDADTIHVVGRAENTRLVGFDAPETYWARCKGERILGEAAEARFRELIHSGTLDLIFVRCSCKTGTEGTKSCNQGRSCATLSVGGKDIGAILIDEDHALPYICTATKCPRQVRRGCP